MLSPEDGRLSSPNNAEPPVAHVVLPPVAEKPPVAGDGVPPVAGVLVLPVAEVAEPTSPSKLKRGSSDATTIAAPAMKRQRVDLTRN